MSNAVFPTLIRGLDANSTKTPSFSTIVQSSVAGYTLRVPEMQNPLWQFTLTYNYIKNKANDIPVGLTYTDLQTLMGFYLARQGQLDSFLYDDPTDDSVGPALLIDASPNLQAQLQVVNDGAGNYYSPVQRNMGGQFYEDITDLNGGITVYANGVAQVGSGVDYNLLGPGLVIPGYSFGGLYLQWVAGAPAAPVTAQFDFYFRVRFDIDKREFDAFLNEVLWCLGGPDATNSNSLTFVTARPPTA